MLFVLLARCVVCVLGKINDDDDDDDEKQRLGHAEIQQILSKVLPASRDNKNCTNSVSLPFS